MNWPPFGRRQEGPFKTPKVGPGPGGAVIRPPVQFAKPQDLARMDPSGGMGTPPPGVKFDPASMTEMILGTTGGQSKPGGFDLESKLAALGGPPQRPPLPVRPGPDRSAGSILSQALAGASDVVGAGAGIRPQNLDKVQALALRERDARYQDELMRSAADFENKNRNFGFGLQKIGMEQGADRERFGRGMEEKRFGLAERGQEHAIGMGDWQKGFAESGRGIQQTNRAEDIGRAKEIRTEDLLRQKPFDEAKLSSMTAAEARAAAEEARRAELHGVQMPVLRKAAEDATGRSAGTVNPAFLDQMIGEAPLEQATRLSERLKSDVLEKVQAGTLSQMNGAAQIKAINEAMAKRERQERMRPSFMGGLGISDPMKLAEEHVTGWTGYVDPLTMGAKGLGDIIRAAVPGGNAPGDFNPFRKLLGTSPMTPEEQRAQQAELMKRLGLDFNRARMAPAE